LSELSISCFVCLAALAWLVLMLRSNRVSLGLPVAYLSLLLLDHVPGAFLHAVGEGALANTNAVEIGIRLVAIGSVCFVAGVWLAGFGSTNIPTQGTADRNRFWLFCLVGGYIFSYGLSFLRSVPSLGAVVENGGGIWVLGVMLGLRASLSQREHKWACFWLAALAIYPITGLVSSGFLSYATRAVTIVCCALVISSRSSWRVVVSMSLVTILGLTIFVNYFAHRNAIRAAVWGGAALEERINVVTDAFKQLELIDLTNETHKIALDERLNQNFFVGLSAQRIEEGQTNYLYGRSVWEAVLSVIPRALWPDKPVGGGSGRIVSEMTGLELSTTTAWGVGNVMEFYINFGVGGLIAGFLLMGWALRTLDYKAAAAEIRGDLGRAILFFLPGAALIQPGNSMVELTGGAAAALIAAHGWKWAWTEWAGPRPATRMLAKDARKSL
jgi:hypothetical protein